jgi:hypothetical protein
MLNSSEAVEKIVFLPKTAQQFKLDIYVVSKFHNQTAEFLLGYVASFHVD